jgi:uncharacterized membrane protein
MKRMSAIFVRGLIAMLPLAVTIVVLYWLGVGAERTLGIGIKWFLPESSYVPGMGVAAGFVLTLLLGLLVNVWGMPQLIRRGENAIGHIPFVKTFYGALRDLLGFFTKAGGIGAVNKVVVVSLGQTGVQLVGLLTREDFSDLPSGLGGEGLVAVYVPFSYQLGGATIIVPRARVQSIDMRLEDAMRFVVTAGVKAETSAASPTARSSAKERESTGDMPRQSNTPNSTIQEISA